MNLIKITLFFILILSPLAFFLDTVFANSSLFIRQQITDGAFDLPQVLPSSDIRFVNYESDNKLLVITIWLSSPIILDKLHHQGVSGLTYGVFIDRDSNKATGWEGVDYDISYTLTKKLSEVDGLPIEVNETIFKEYGGSGPDFSRTLKSPEGFKVYFNKDERFIQITIDLAKMGFPNNYQIMSYTRAIKGYTFGDFTNWIDFPARQFNLLTFPDPLIVRKGEHKDIRLAIGNTEDLNVSKINIINLTNNNGIELKSIGINQKTGQPLDPQQFTINVAKETSSGPRLEQLQVSINTTESIPSIIYKNFTSLPTTSSISKTIHLNVTVEEELNIFQMLKSLWDEYGEFISFMGAGFSGGAATYFFDYLKTRKKKLHYK